MGHSLDRRRTQRPPRSGQWAPLAGWSPVVPGCAGSWWVVTPALVERIPALKSWQPINGAGVWFFSRFLLLFCRGSRLDGRRCFPRRISLKGTSRLQSRIELFSGFWENSQFMHLVNSIHLIQHFFVAVAVNRNRNIARTQAAAPSSHDFAKTPSFICDIAPKIQITRSSQDQSNR